MSYCTAWEDSFDYRQNFESFESSEWCPDEPEKPVLFVVPHPVLRGSAEDPALKIQFDSLAANWRRETRYCSSAMDLVLNPHYQRIIGMGPVVVPLILRDLSTRLGHWFWALTAITGENSGTARICWRSSQDA